MFIAKQTESPDFLSGSALDKWKELAPKLYQLGFFEETDRDCLFVYCEMWANWLELQQQDDHDIEKMVKLSDSLLNYEDALGLNPAARLKIEKNISAERWG